MASTQELESAFQRFLACPELLMAVGELLICDKDSLRSLCLASRDLNAVFSPQLHNAVTLVEHEHPLHTRSGWLSRLAHSEQTTFVKTLRVRLAGPRIRTQCVNWTFRPALPAVIKRMTNLKAVEVTGLTLGDTWLRHIGRLDKLEDLCLSFQCSLDLERPGRLPVTGGKQIDVSHIGSLGKLQSLAFKNVFFDDGIFTPGLLASILVASPGPQSLSLSIDGEPCNAILGNVCMEYAASGSEALQLRWLSLGICVHAPEADILHRLCNLAVLERIYISQCSCQSFALSGARLPCWPLLQPSVTPRLQHVELQFATIVDWDFMPTALEGRKSLKIAGIRNDGAMESMTLGKMASRATVPMLRIPIPAFSKVSLDDNFRSLESCVWLTHLCLGMQKSLCSNPKPGVFNCCLSVVERTFARLPALKALSVVKLRYHAVMVDACHSVDKISSTVEAMAAASQSLEYVELFDEAFLIERGTTGSTSVAGSVTVTRLARRVKADWEPKFFKDTWSNGFRNGVGAC